MPSVTRQFAVIAAVAIAVLVSASAASAQQASDYISSSNVTLLKRIPTAGDGVGARVVGNYLYVTSTKDLEIFDITNPEDPQLVGDATVNIEFENEEVPTNGKLLGISGQTPTVNIGGVCPSTYPASPSGCLALYDVRDKAAPRLITNVQGAGDHTSGCVLDCTYLYGSAGSITDATKAFDTPGVATKIGNWQSSPTVPDYNGTKSGKFNNGCHNVQEIRPGILFGACQPALVMSVNAEDGGSIMNPKVLAAASNEDKRFIHSVHWPRKGADKFSLLGGETNFNPRCELTLTGAFMTFGASHANLDGNFDGPLDEYRPVNGSYLDSNPPAQVLGCSVHWFEEHPTFNDGGLVALATYENGTRFLQITPEGKIKEQGFFIPLGGSTSAPHWAPGGSDVVYAVDYTRGLDVLKYTGDHYVPGNTPEPGRTPGTSDPGGGSPPPAQQEGNGAPVCKASAGFRSVSVAPLRPNDAHSGRTARPGPGLSFTVDRREEQPFDVEVVRQATGKRLIRNHVVKRFRNRTGSFEWNGKGAPDGYYTVRFRMALASKGSDVRRIALRRSRGLFRSRPASYLRDTCGALSAFKVQRPVFGGAIKRPLNISYRLPTGVDSVEVVARARGKLLRRFTEAGTEAGRTYRLSLPTRGIKRGTDVRIRITVQRAGSKQVSTLVSRRL
jgi:hypothetical protein